MTLRSARLLAFAVMAVSVSAFATTARAEDDGGCYQCHTNGYCEPTPYPNEGKKGCCDPNSACLNFCLAEGDTCRGEM